ncbi:hypothetical protein GJ744_008604 [Endocarpon pusillum]|uniref:C2H2-type domain-containing protein n=1 Tax=Endocarpon pusillum TaxID=364733 RepID=A0A8H7APN1_9EURO|nr:hypothetical protein GJ744_008604 [Endocarpon pusillum]
MAHSYAFNHIVSTVSNAFDPKTDPRVPAIVEQYRRSVDDHNKSQTPSLLIKRRQAFAELQRLHNEVMARIKAEIIEYKNSSLFFDDDLDKQEIYWAVMQSHGELDPINNYDSKQANFKDLMTIHDTLPQPEVKSKNTSGLWLGTVNDNYRFCKNPGCDWKTELNNGSTYILRNHMVTDHGMILFPCRKGCPRTFRTDSRRQRHEASKHGNSAAWQPTRPRKGIKSLNSSADSETTEKLPAEDHPHSSEETDLKDRVSESDDHELKTSVGEPSELKTNDVGYTPAENLGEDATVVDPIHSTAATREDAIGKIKVYSTQCTSDGSFHYCPYTGCLWKVRVHKHAVRTIRAHIRTKHIKICFSCQAPGCDTSYTSDSNRRMHELEMHGIVTAKPGTIEYPCPGCQLTFISTYHRDEHATRVCIARVA